jgi:hypothetical protein
MPKNGELIDEFCDRVSDLGIPVSEDGMKVCEKLDDEYEKRDQDARDMHIFNDWNGWGMSEVMENLLKDFNRDIFKKTISPFKKWAYLEGLACFFKAGDIMYLISMSSMIFFPIFSRIQGAYIEQIIKMGRESRKSSPCWELWF